MPEVEPDLDASAPVFFFSYAREHPLKRGPLMQLDPNLRAKRLFTELSYEVNNLVGRDPGADPGFMDQSMAGGEVWQAELLRAVGTCQVFVALLSPAYMTCKYCAMEWNAFSQRPVTRRDPHRHVSSIIPVVWTPSRSGTVPSAVNKIQRFTPHGLRDDSLAHQYSVDGLRGLFALGGESTDGIVLRLAQHIVDVAWQNKVEWRVPPDTEHLSRTFG